MNRPKMTQPEVFKLPGVSTALTAGPVIIGIRGYFRDSMGKAGENDRGIYDDAAFVMGPAGEFLSFNWNTDPSKYLPGIAVLQPGEYKWAQGIHGRRHITDSTADKTALEWLESHVMQDHPDAKYRLTYWAYRQAGPFTILRDGKTVAETETDPAKYPWIDGHHGAAGTSSEGCQTVPIEQWHEMRAFGYSLMNKYKVKTITYKLIVQP